MLIRPFSIKLGMRFIVTVNVSNFSAWQFVAYIHDLLNLTQPLLYRNWKSENGAAPINAASESIYDV